MAILAKTATNPVAQVLMGHGSFYEWRDYPQGGAWDTSSGYGYYYHAHPGAAFQHEHGHFHVLRREGAETWHLASIAMDAFGGPIGIFMPNIWHLGSALLDQKTASHWALDCSLEVAFPCYAANLWLAAHVREQAALIGQLHAEATKGIQALGGETAVQDRGLMVLAAQAHPGR